jgi:hypothetical protein
MKSFAVGISHLCRLILSLGFACIADAADQNPAKPVPLKGFITSIAVEWNPQLVPPSEPDPTRYLESVKYDATQYLKAYGLMLNREIAPAEAVTLRITLNDPAGKSGKGPSFNTLLGIPKLSAVATLTDASGSTLQTLKISFTKTGGLQISHDGGPWSWLSLRSGRHIAESLHPVIESKPKDSFIDPSTPIPTDAGRVVLYRPSTRQAIGMKPLVMLDGQEKGRIANNRVLSFDIPPGKHTLSAVWNGILTDAIALPPVVTDFEISAGSTLYFEYAYNEGKSTYEYGLLGEKRTQEMIQTMNPVEESLAKPAVEKLIAKQAKKN